MKLFSIKNKKYTFMIIFFISLFLFVDNCYALSWKQTEFTAFSSGESFNGTISNQNKTLTSVFSSDIDTTNFDYLVFPFYKFNLDPDNVFTIDNPALQDWTNYTLTCTNSASNYCTKFTLSPNGTLSSPIYGESYSHEISISAQLWTQETGGSAVLCYFNSIENQLYCPVKNINKVRRLSLYLSTSGTFDYHIEYYRLKSFYNEESSDIISALGQLGTIQQNTTTTIQNFNNYVSNNDTTQAQTNQTTALSNINNTFSQHLSGMNELTQLVFLPVNFIMQVANNECQPLVWDLPFVNQRVVVPCMSTIYNGYFSAIVGTLSTIFIGLLTYRSCIKLFNTFKGVLDAEDDKIEVIDL